jgi:ABC-type transport system involved in cytochrome bd biosynthesis fused ATPase/permease subunit
LSSAPVSDSSRSPLVGGLLVVTRVWLPLGIAVVGLAFTIIGHGKTDLAAAGVCLILIALTVWLINWLFRMSIESNRERDEEEEARRVFDRTGHWPDDA